MREICSSVHHRDLETTVMCVHLRCLMVSPLSFGQWSRPSEGGVVLICFTSCFAWCGSVELFLLFGLKGGIAE